MELMSRTIVVICVIGCLQYVIPLVRALPPEGDPPFDTGPPPIPSDFLIANSEGALFKESIANSEAENTQAIINNAIHATNAENTQAIINNAIHATNEVGTSGAIGGIPLVSTAFNTDLQSSQVTSTQVGSGSSKSTVSSTQGSGGAGDGLILNRNVRPSTSTSNGQTVTNGFLAKVSGQISPSPPRIRPAFFSPARLGNKMRLSTNRLHRTGQPFLAKLAKQQTRTFSAIPRPSGITVPFTAPVFNPSFTFSPMNFEQPSLASFASPLRTERPPTFYSPSPEMFRTSFYSPSAETFPRAPVANWMYDFSSAPLPSTSVDVPTFSSFSPLMSIQNSPDFSLSQAFDSSGPPNFALNSLPEPRMLPPFAAFPGPSSQFRMFSREPETSVTVLPPIEISSFNTQPSIDIRPPPPPARLRQSSPMISGPAPIPVAFAPFDSPSMPVSPPPAQFQQSSMRSAQTPITVIPLAPVDSRPMPVPSSLPVSPQFRQSTTFSGPAPLTVSPLATFDSPPMPVSPAQFQQSSTFSGPAPFTVTPFSTFDSPPMPVSPPPAQFKQSSMRSAQNPITVIPLAPVNSPPMSVPSSIPVAFPTTRAFSVQNFAPFRLPMHSEGTNILGFSRGPNFLTRAGGNIGVPMGGAVSGPVAGTAAAGAGSAQGVGNGVFSAGMPLQTLPPVLTQFNDFGRPILSQFQAF